MISDCRRVRRDACPAWQTEQPGLPEWERSFPVRLYPFLSREIGDQRSVAIDPAIAFGRPILAGSSIVTATIAERIDAGETVSEVAADYDLTAEEIEEAVLYERAA